MKRAALHPRNVKSAAMGSQKAVERTIGRQFFFAIVLLLGVFLLGTVGYLLIGGGRWSLIDCAYMTAISLTTVGYGDVLGIQHNTGAKIFTMGLLFTGMGVTLYSVSSLTALVVELHLYRMFEMHKMKKELARLNDHFIVCGGGSTGIHILKEFIDTGQSFVLLEQSEEAIAHVQALFPGILYIQGNAMDELVLNEAGIERARGLVATLHLDSENMFLTVSSRFFNPNMKIAVKCVEHSNTELFRRAGAAYVVSPNFIGGMRMASELLRPHVVSFLDKMLRGNPEGDQVRISEVVVRKDSTSLGRTLREIDVFGTCGLQVVALGCENSDTFQYNPPLSATLSLGSVLVVIGSIQQVEALEGLINYAHTQRMVGFID